METGNVSLLRPQDGFASAYILVAGVSEINHRLPRFHRFFSLYHPMTKYVLSVFIGRFPRYYLVAMIGDIYQIPDYYLIIMIAVLIIIPVISYYIGRFMLKRQKQENVSKVDIEPTTGS